MNPFRRGQRKRPCESLTFPHAHTYARLYLNGWRCARHTPAAQQGKPETPPGPGWPIHREPPPETTEPPTEEQEQSRDR
ncbi:hypothetical protein [Streptomyces griseoluteus]|uniref:hypothetical protein n=1 Tax=Streptomyces griseoluteus TaxID=29306 RepID=UPI0037F448BF